MALYREQERLAALVRTDPGLTPAERAEFESSQRLWRQGREDCARAENADGCRMTSTLGRIAELRASSAAARGSADAGISRGPFVLACQPQLPEASLTLVDAGEGAAFLRVGEEGAALLRRYDRYLGATRTGAFAMTVSGSSIRLSLPNNAAPYACRLGPSP